MPRKIDTREQSIGSENDLLLPSTGEIVRDDKELVVADKPLSDNYTKEIAFMEEPIDVMVHESTDPNAENPVMVGCNGVNQFFIRGQVQTVKRKYVEILARAKTTAIQTREVRDFNNELATKIVKSTALRYPFSVVSDSNPIGGKWLKEVLSEA